MAARCPKCHAALDEVLFEESWFEATGSHAGDSGPGGNTPQEPVAWGWQTCPECYYRFEASG